jgi:hypothetical protein
MAKNIEVWYSVNNDFWKSEPVYESDVNMAGMQTGFTQKVKTGFSPIHTFHTPAEVYDHFLEATELANGGMYYVFWQVTQNRPREEWSKKVYTMAELRKATDTKKFIKDQWK